MKNDDFIENWRRVAREPNVFMTIFPALLLMAASLWILAADYFYENYPGAMFLDQALFVRRQLISGAAALGLSLGVGRFLPGRAIPRFWWAPWLLIGVVAATAGIIRIFMTPVRVNEWVSLWWGAPGFAAAIVALVGGLGWAVPRFRPGRLSDALPLFSVVMATLLFAGFFSGPTFLLLVFPILLMVFLATMTGKCLRHALAMFALVFLPGLAALLVSQPYRVSRIISHFSRTAEPLYQVEMALGSIRAGGITGVTGNAPLIPEWPDSFIFARLCGVGGLLAGLAVLALAGLLITLAWRLAGRLKEPLSCALGATLAAVLTIQPLAHAAVNLGLLPPVSVHFPFLSHNPRLLLLDGLLLGLLIALGRASGTERNAGGQCPPVSRIIAGSWVVIALLGLRLVFLVFVTPS